MSGCGSEAVKADSWELEQLCDLNTVMQLPLPLLQPPNKRGHGTSEVSRVRCVIGGGRPEVVYVKRQRDFSFRDRESFLFRRPTLMREYRNLEKLSGLGVIVPEVLCFQHDRNHRAVLITRELDGYIRFDRALSGCAAPMTASLPTRLHVPVAASVADPILSARTRLFGCLGRVLAVVYGANLQHGCLYPGHILVQSAAETVETTDLALIDLEKMHPTRRLKRAMAKDISQLLRRLPNLREAELAALLAPLQNIAPTLREALHKDMARRKSRVLWGSPY